MKKPMTKNISSMLAVLLVLTWTSLSWGQRSELPGWRPRRARVLLVVALQAAVLQPEFLEWATCHN